jgi:two-component system chemotaxis response regulator CheY
MRKTMRALIIDDSKSMRLILSRLLKAAGFEIFEAVHGKDALEQLTKHGKFELALVDWNMPEMNGLEFVQRVRADGTYTDMKLMMVTTEAEMERVTAAITAGADEYVMKPFTADVLKDKLSILGLAA